MPADPSQARGRRRVGWGARAGPSLPLGATRSATPDEASTTHVVVTADPKPASSRPAPASGGSTRLDSLTGLRFFAAAAIVVYHSYWPFTGSTELGLFHYSYTAVGFFFTLSGVVLAWSWKPGTGVLVQWRRRAARILPLHWLMLGAMVATYLVWPLTHPA